MGSPRVVLLNVRELNLYYHEAKAVCLDPAVGEVVSSLLCADQVRLFSETYLNKPPGGLPTPWHQDWPLQPFDRRDTVNCWVALDDISMEQGPLHVVSGSHRLGPCICRPISPSSPPWDRCCPMKTVSSCGCLRRQGIWIARECRFTGCHSLPVTH